MTLLRTQTLAVTLLLGTASAVAATRIGHPATAPAAGPVAVRIDNFTFNAPTVTVKVGTTVTWTNGDDIPHTVVAKDHSFKSAVLDTGDKFSFTFARAGTYDYFCSIHPHMTGRVVVKG